MECLGRFLNRGSCHVLRHWYSNVGGSIVKMGDSDIHMPIKTTNKKHKAQKTRTKKQEPLLKAKHNKHIFLGNSGIATFLLKSFFLM